MVTEQKEYKAVARPKSVNCLCCNCGEIYGGNAAGGCARYCSQCKTAPDKAKINEENKKIKEERDGK